MSHLLYLCSHFLSPTAHIRNTSLLFHRSNLTHQSCKVLLPPNVSLTDHEVPTSQKDPTVTPILLSKLEEPHCQRDLVVDYDCRLGPG